MRLAVAGLVRAHWTSEIHDEWMRNVEADYPDVTRADLERTRSLMQRALPDAQVSSYEQRISDLSLPDPDDRHVLAAAIEIGADEIVTFNETGFPTKRLDPYGIAARHPDDVVTTLLAEQTGDVLGVLRQHRASLRRPSKSPAEYVALLRRAGLERTADQVAGRKETL